jgi:hypothetical protein
MPDRNVPRSCPVLFHHNPQGDNRETHEDLKERDMDPAFKPPNCPNEYDAKEHTCINCDQREPCRIEFLEEQSVLMMKQDQNGEDDDPEMNNTFFKDLDEPPFPTLADFDDRKVMDHFARNLARFVGALKKYKVPISNAQFVFDLYELYHQKFPHIWKIWHESTQQEIKTGPE